MSLLNDLRMHSRFARELPGFLRYRISLDEARALLRRGVEEREANFLRVARHGIYGYPSSPYLPLLKRAGCAFGDLETAVGRQGLEPTLRALRNEGVYFTFEEYKGRVPVVRGGEVIPVEAQDFDNPHLASVYEASTGGSTSGAGTRVAVDLETMKAQVPHIMMKRAVHGLLGAPAAIWRGPLPDPTGIGLILRTIPYRGQPQRWFTHTRTRYGTGLKNQIATFTILATSRLHGVRLPHPERVPVHRAGVIARWARDAVRTHGQCEINTSVGLALRVCLAALDEHVDLAGVVFTAGGEPYTPARARVVAMSGARLVPHYVSVDAGPTGLGCAHPSCEDDIHLTRDCLALIQHPRRVLDSDVTVDAFYFTSLRPTAAKILLNVESDDYGVVERRACGCGFEEVGYVDHLSRIRSFGKLTGEGVTLVGSEMARILEEVLPARFGGSPFDFQLLEEEDEHGLSRLVIFASPRLQIERDEAVVEAVLEALGRSSVAADIARGLWKQTGTFQVRRAEPVWTGRGKFMPIRVAGRFAGGDGGRTGDREAASRSLER